MESPKSRYLFIDLNSYFATGEQQANPKLRGRPIGVCEHSGGLILAPSREAKKFGVKTGMPTWEARKICPGIVFTVTNPNQIRALTARFYRIAEQYSADIEHLSVDEVSINLTEVCFSWSEAIEIAKEIKLAIKRDMGEWVTASIGIAESRLLAKIGTDLQKPDGLVLITDEPGIYDGAKVVSVPELYDLLELEDVPGIGWRTARNLGQKGIKTLRELSAVPVGTLHAWFGIQGVWLFDLSHFQDAWRDVDLDRREAKSIGHQFSLSKRNALYARKEVFGLLWKLTERVTARLRKQDLLAGSISTYVRYATGGGKGGSKRLGDYYGDSATLMKVADQLLEDIDLRCGITYVAVTVHDLKPVTGQASLFEEYDRGGKVSETIDKINNRYGELTIIHAPTLAAGDVAKDTVGFGRTRERHDWQED